MQRARSTAPAPVPAPASVLAAPPVVLLSTTYGHSHYRYVLANVVGRLVVFPAATDGTAAVRSGDKLLFTLPVTSSLLDAGNIGTSMQPADVTELALEALALTASACNTDFKRDTETNYDALRRLPLEIRALMLWCAHARGDLAAKCARSVALDAWAARIDVLCAPRAEEDTADLDATPGKRRREDSTEAAPVAKRPRREPAAVVV